MTRGGIGAGAGSDAGRNWSGAGAAMRSGATGGAGAGAAMRSGVIGGAGAGEVRLVLVLDGRVLFCAGAVAGARAGLV